MHRGIVSTAPNRRTSLSGASRESLPRGLRVAWRGCWQQESQGEVDVAFARPWLSGLLLGQELDLCGVRELGDRAQHEMEQIGRILCLPKTRTSWLS